MRRRFFAALLVLLFCSVVVTPLLARTIPTGKVAATWSAICTKGGQIAIYSGVSKTPIAIMDCPKECHCQDGVCMCPVKTCPMCPTCSEPPACQSCPDCSYSQESCPTCPEKICQANQPCPGCEVCPVCEGGGGAGGGEKTPTEPGAAAPSSESGESVPFKLPKK